jgi:cullin 2
MSDAELTYGSLSTDHTEQMKEIGELGLEIWKRLVSLSAYLNESGNNALLPCQMIEPLKEDLVRLLLEGIRYDRINETTGSTSLGSHYQSDAVIKGVINSFVNVEEYKKKGNLDVGGHFNSPNPCL